MKKLVRLTGLYKMGHQHLRTQMALNPDAILRIETVPEEVPEHQDGMITRVATPGGDIFVAETYAEASAAWEEALVE